MNDSLVQNLINEFQVPVHVLEHSEKVAKVAYFLGKKLTEKGIRVDLELVRQAALLHDLVRICDMRNFNPHEFTPSPNVEQMMKWNEIREKYEGIHHADAAYEILLGKGLTELARIVKRHKFISILEPLEGPQTWEEKLVYYADKRVVHGKITDLEERIQEGRARNLRTQEERDISSQAEVKIRALEKELFDEIGLTPDVVNRLK